MRQRDQGPSVFDVWLKWWLPGKGHHLPSLSVASLTTAWCPVLGKDLPLHMSTTNGSNAPMSVDTYLQERPI